MSVRAVFHRRSADRHRSVASKQAAEAGAGRALAISGAVAPTTLRHPSRDRRSERSAGSRGGAPARGSGRGRVGVGLPRGANPLSLDFPPPPPPGGPGGPSARAPPVTPPPPPANPSLSICKISAAFAGDGSSDAHAALLGYDRRLCAEVVSAFVGETRSLAPAASEGRSRARHRCGRAHGGRRGTKEDGQRSPIECALPRIEQILRAHGRSLDPEMQDDEPPELCLDEPGLAACYAAAARGVSVSGERAGQAVLRLVVSPQPTAAATGNDGADPVAELRGFGYFERGVAQSEPLAQIATS